MTADVTSQIDICSAPVEQAQAWGCTWNACTLGHQASEKGLRFPHLSWSQPLAASRLSETLHQTLAGSTGDAAVKGIVPDRVCSQAWLSVKVV